MAELNRRAILDALGVTEDDMAELDRVEARNGYTAAKAGADAERAAFLVLLRERAGRSDWRTMMDDRKAQLIGDLRGQALAMLPPAPDSLDAAWAEAEAAIKAMPDRDWSFAVTWWGPDDCIATASNARLRKRGSRMVQTEPMAPAAALHALAAKLRKTGGG
jgi:hypothetical protein